MSGITDNNALIQSFIGTKVAESIPRFSLIENEIGKRVLPVFPFIPPMVQNNEQIASGKEGLLEKKIWRSDPSKVENQFFPLSFRRRSESEAYFTLPYEPIISISSTNNIVKRTVAKNVDIPGTIKERFSQGDYKITITGSLFGEKSVGRQEECFPREHFELLKQYCTHPQGLEVRCEPLQLLGINHIVVEEFRFPFTKGENVQAYIMECVSDFTADFLLEIE